MGLPPSFTLCSSWAVPLSFSLRTFIEHQLKTGHLLDPAAMDETALPSGLSLCGAVSLHDLEVSFSVLGGDRGQAEK